MASKVWKAAKSGRQRKRLTLKSLSPNWEAELTTTPDSHPQASGCQSHVLHRQRGPINRKEFRDLAFWQMPGQWFSDLTTEATVT